MGSINMRKKEMMRSNRIGLFIARWFPFLVKSMVKKMMDKINDPEKSKDFMLNVFERMAEPDRAVLRILKY